MTAMSSELRRSERKASIVVEGCPIAARIPSESSRDAADEELELMLVGGITVMDGIVVGKDDRVLDDLFFLWEKRRN